MIACSVMALVKEEESKKEETDTEKNSWSKWKRGGIIGAAAVTGGALLAITGGMHFYQNIYNCNNLHKIFKFC